MFRSFEHVLEEKKKRKKKTQTKKQIGKLYINHLTQHCSVTVYKNISFLNDAAVPTCSVLSCGSGAVVLIGGFYYALQCLSPEVCASNMKLRQKYQDRNPINFAKIT